MIILDFGLTGQENMSLDEKIQFYRKYVYEIGAIKNRGATISEKILEKERKKDYKLTKTDLFLYKTRYFSDSGVIGSKEFVEKNYHRFKHHFISKKKKKPKPIEGLDGIFSMKKLIRI